MDAVESVTELVGKMAGRAYRRSPALREAGDVADARQTGFLGAILAARRFDPAAGAPFDAYAMHSIRGAILNAARDGGLVKIPKRLQRRGAEYRTTERLDPAALTEAAAMPTRRARRLFDLQVAVQEFLLTLAAREVVIVSLYFGLDGGAPLQLKEIAPQLGLGVSSISMILTRILLKGREFPPLRDLVRRPVEQPGRRRQWATIGRKGHKWR